LAEPDKQWARGYSARTLAHCWEESDGLPAEVRQVFSQDEVLASAEPLLVLPEWKVPLPGGGRPSQNDVWVLAGSKDGLISMSIEGKVEEPFDKTVAEWKKDASTGKQLRLEFLRECLGLERLPDSIRYQLLHRTASAVIEAKRFGAKRAVMLVHSFSRQNSWYDEFAAFVGLFGPAGGIGTLHQVRAKDGIPLYLAWVHGDERYLTS
jgi:hypothetical protein